MTSTVIRGIGQLVTGEPALGDGLLGTRTNAAVVIDDGVVTWVGDSGAAPAADDAIDADGACVLPGFVDSHAHLVFAGDRTDEFSARMAGERYAAGGIRTTVAATRAATDDELRANVARLTAEMFRQGTTTVEIKSGYGLNVADEVRSLRIASEFTTETTFLGAHVVPAGSDPGEYVQLVTGEMLTACAPYARWADVFCEEGAFDVGAARKVLMAAKHAGLELRVHANQLRPGPGVQLAVELDAASADHCTYLSDDDVDALAHSGTVATLLPGVEFSTRSPFPDGRRLLSAGVRIALATDCNPGTSYTSSMPFCIALAVREMGLTCAEAVAAATSGGAEALRRSDVGRLAPGFRGDAIVLDTPRYEHLAYRPGVPLIRTVIRDGAKVSTERELARGV
ncbi:imidazolonepropionase [Fodinicola feengrottensis]|uniref:Imidazolonepropionase n=1 Tax=Fodinicola feengrottensis TaxID=435914 RepID=A0ABN2IGR5_9ACTN